MSKNVLIRLGALLLLAFASARSSAQAHAEEEPCKDFDSCESACIKGDQRACTRIELFLVRACEDHNDRAACSHLAVLYNTGGPLPTALDLWVKYSNKACDLGDGGGCTDVGVGYAQGLGGLPKDDVRAVQFFKKSCDLGDALGCRNYGGRLMNGKGVARDVPLAREILQKGCDAKDAGSCTKLGNVLDDGDGVAKDPEGALRLYERGCVLGDALACENATKEGGKVDGPRQWDVEKVRKSCEGGFQLDCWELGRMYYFGRGVDIDKAKALSIVSKSCEANWPESCDQAARWFEEGAGTKRDVKHALRLYQKACTLGYGVGCDMAGDLLRLGREGFPARPSGSVEWYARGCDLNYERACFGLGTVLGGAKGVKADFKRANAALEKACAAKMACACNDLAVSYWTGRGVSVDKEKAKALLAGACTDGCKAACGFGPSK